MIKKNNKLTILYSPCHSIFAKKSETNYELLFNY